MSDENERLNWLLTRNRFAEAEKAARECCGKYPDWGTGYTQLGRALAGLGRHAEAVDAAREGVRKSPKDAWALAILGYTLKHAGKLSDAAEALYDAARTDPTYTWTYCMLAEVELDRGRTKDAYQATVNGVRHDPNAENLLRWKAWCEYQLDMLDDAVATAESGLRQHPNSPLLRNVMGCVRWHQAERTYRPLRKVRLHAAAHDYLLESVRLNPSEDVYRNNLTRNARACRKYVAERLLLLAVAVPMAALTGWVLAVGPGQSPLMALPVVLAVTFVVKLGLDDELLRAAPLRWAGVPPSPPGTDDERRRGRRKLRWFAITYAVWLAALATAGLLAAGALGRPG